MKSLDLLNNSMLKETLKEAVKHKLDKRFIKLLEDELMKRGIRK